MKIVELKIDVVTTEKRWHKINDPDAIDADEDGDFSFEYTAKLKKPQIKVLVKLQTEAHDQALIPGGVYMFTKDSMRFYANDKTTLIQTEYAVMNPEDFKFNIEDQPVLISQAFREGA